jgi:hypothetical protein
MHVWQLAAIGFVLLILLATSTVEAHLLYIVYGRMLLLLVELYAFPSLGRIW